MLISRGKAMKKLIKRLLLGSFVLLLILLGLFGYQKYQDLKRVQQFEPLVRKELAKYQLTEYTESILAIIMTESKGEGDDPMQSFESLTQQAGKFDDSKRSVQQGVKHFVDLYQHNKQLQCDFATVIQAYNFGMDYIDYVAQHGKKHSLDLAEKYSKEKLAPALGNTSQVRYRYLHIISILHNGGYLYRNGGNFYYAQLVKLNQFQLHWYQKIMNS